MSDLFLALRCEYKGRMCTRLSSRTVAFPGVPVNDFGHVMSTSIPFSRASPGGSYCMTLSWFDSHGSDQL